MPWLVVGGAALALVGTVLVLLSGRHPDPSSARPTWDDGSPAALRALHPLLDRLAAIDTALDRLAHAIDTLMPGVGLDVPAWGVPSHEDVVGLCALVRHRLVALARHDLAGAPPSRSAARFAELSATAIPPVADPNEARLPAADFPFSRAREADDAGRFRPAGVLADPQRAVGPEPDGPDAAVVGAAVERYRLRRQGRDAAARQELVRSLVAAGPALRADYRQLQRPHGRDVGAVARALRVAAAAYLDVLWPLCAGPNRDGPVVVRSDRSAFSRLLTSAAATVENGDAFLRRGDDGPALRELATLSLPSAPGWAPSEDFVDACRRATHALGAVADGRLVDRVRLVEDCAALVQRHVELLARQGEAAALDRLTRHDNDFRLCMAVARSVDRALVDGEEAGTAQEPVPAPRRPGDVADVAVPVAVADQG